MKPPLGAKIVASRLGMLAIVAYALYGRTLEFGLSYLDDDVLILEAQGSLSRPPSIWHSFARPYFPSANRDHAYYRPLVTASFAFDANRGGSDPHGYRVTNLVLHAVAAGLLYLFLRGFSQSDRIAFFGALIFTVHPALTEAVAWIPGRNDSLLAVWMLVSWLLLNRARAQGHWGFRLAHLCAWLLALFSKEAAVVFPVVYFAYARWIERRPWRETIPVWLVAGWTVALGIYGLARASALPEGMGLAGLSFAALIRAPAVIAGDLGKLVLPVNLSVLAIPEDTWKWPGAVAAGLFVTAWFAPGIRRARLGFAAFCLLVFVAPSIPASKLLTLESRLYLPAIAVVLAACEIAAVFRASVLVGTATASVFVALLAGRAWAYTGDFRDRMAFSLAAVRESPHSSLAHRSLGIAYHVQGDLEGARREYEAALAEDAGEPVAHNNLGVILMAQGHLPEAEMHLREELAINPHYLEAHRNLALVLRTSGREDEAALHWEASLGLGPTADSEALSALVTYFLPRDAARAARFRSLLEARSAASP